VLGSTARGVTGVRRKESMMLNGRALRSRARWIAGVVAVLFGLATVGAGVSVLAGRDPGYLVHRPLVVFNTVMGLLYIGAGILAWSGARTDRAMVLRTGVWLALLLVLMWAGRAPRNAT
jgi:hypothetical protein